MPQVPSALPHSTQLALWGENLDLSAPTPHWQGIVFDKASISISDISDSKRPHVINQLRVNGKTRSFKQYPIFRDFKRPRVICDLPRLTSLPTRARTCYHCGVQMTEIEKYNEGPGGSDRSAAELLEYCARCKFWQVHGVRSEFYEARSTLVANFYISVLSAKIREFETEYPDGTLSEISQWLRRRPDKYNSMTPRYLELLVTRVFDNIGLYAEVHHVGRPGDGGVDVLLVDGQANSWLVQVKRREDARSSEPVSTIRNILGSMVVQKARHAVIVSTADRFTLQAQRETAQAAESSFIVELVDRHALDRLVSRWLPVNPWSKVLEEIRTGQERWINEDWCFCGCMPSPPFTEDQSQQLQT